jgi:hypothetical protein
MIRTPIIRSASIDIKDSQSVLEQSNSVLRQRTQIHLQCHPCQRWKMRTLKSHGSYLSSETGLDVTS